MAWLGIIQNVVQFCGKNECKLRMEVLKKEVANSNNLYGDDAVEHL